MPVAAPAAAFDLTTVAQVQALATVAKADIDSGVLQGLITGLSRQVLTRCARRTLNAVQSFTDVLDGPGTAVLYLRDSPIKTVTSVTVNGQVVPQSTNGLTGGWTFDDISILLLPGTPPGWGTAMFAFGSSFDVFPVGRRNVTVVYSAGYDNVSNPPGNPGYNGAPDDLGAAVTELVVQQYKRRDWIDQASKNLAAGESVTYRDWQWSPMVAAVVDSYARVLAI